MDFSVEILIGKLNERGVTISDMASIVFDLQKKYINDITLQLCEESIIKVLEKREVAYTILTGIAIDIAAEKRLLGEINHVIHSDNSLYGIDEIMALSIVNVHGSIALTNFGFLDKEKPGIIGQLDLLGKEDGVCHTFLDDIICAIISSAASRLAHYSVN